MKLNPNYIVVKYKLEDIAGHNMEKSEELQMARENVSLTCSMGIQECGSMAIISTNPH